MKQCDGCIRGSFCGTEFSDRFPLPPHVAATVKSYLTRANSAPDRRFGLAGASPDAGDICVVDRNAAEVAHVVAASAANPALLPALDEVVAFTDRNGAKHKRRVLPTDCGVYDSLGVTCLEQGRQVRSATIISGRSTSSAATRVKASFRMIPSRICRVRGWFVPSSPFSEKLKTRLRTDCIS